MMYLIKNKLCFEKFVFFKIYLNGNKQYAMHCGQNTTLSQALSGMCSLTEKRSTMSKAKFMAIFKVQNTTITLL